MDAALRRGLVTLREIDECGIGDERRRTWVRSHASPTAQSLAETYARVTMREAGLDVRAQARIRGVGSVDLLVEGALIVEVDGRSYHSDERQFALDRQRDRTAALQGLTTVRFTHSEVVKSVFEVVEEVVALLWRRELAPPTLRTRMDAAARVSDPSWWR
jgi:very-short-patch-repair endonuclease